MANESYSATYNAKDDDGNVVSSDQITVEYDMGDDLASAVEKFGEEIVFAHFKAHAAVSLQARIRAAAKAGDDPQATVDAWVPGQVTRRGKSQVEKATAVFEKMSADDQQAFIEKLQAAAQG